MIIEEIMAVFSLYFLGLEILQVKSDGFAYFTSIWNFIDFIPPVVILSLYLLQEFYGVLDDFKSEDPNHERNKEIVAVCLSIATFCLWMKGLYFLRI